MSWAVNMSQIKAARYSLFGRVGDRKTGAHFCATRSYSLFKRVVDRKTGAHFCATRSSLRFSSVFFQRDCAPRKCPRN